MRVTSNLAWRTAVAARNYELTDLLHDRRAVCVPAEGIVGVLSAWLAELDVVSPLVEDLARTVRNDDWPAVHDIATRLSVDITIAA